jgi:hypothetical protein
MANYDSKSLAVFNTVCRTIDGENLKYTADKEKLVVFLSAKGDDLPIGVMFKADADRSVLTVHSLLDTKADEDKRVEFAVAVNAANYALVNGSFDYDVSDGKIAFRMAQPYFDGGVSEEVVKYLLYCTFSTVDEYNDRFLMLGKGMIDISKFIELANS